MDENSDSTENQHGSYNIDYGPGKDKMFYVLAFYVSAIGLGILYLAWKLKGYNRPEKTFDQMMMQYEQGDERDANVSGQQRQDGTRRRRNIQSRIQDNLNTVRQQENNDEDSNRRSCEKENEPTERVGVKKMKKMQAKEERRKQREAMEMERADKQKRQEEEKNIRIIAAKKEEEIEKQKEEEDRKARETKEREAHELYLEMKRAFEVNEEGQDTVEGEEQQQNKLKEFVNYLKEEKVVLLEDLASHFGLRTKDAIDRVQDLLKEEIITGVIDDRGKFIYITPEELQAVAAFVKQRGRVAINEIAAVSNSLINLGKDSDVAK